MNHLTEKIFSLRDYVNQPRASKEEEVWIDLNPTKLESATKNLEQQQPSFSFHIRVSTFSKKSIKLEISIRSSISNTILPNFQIFSVHATYENTKWFILYQIDAPTLV